MSTPGKNVSETKLTAYDDLLAAGCRIDNHESDLYVEATKTASDILKRHGTHYSSFVSNIDGDLWYEAVGAYDPFWTARASK